MKLIEKQSKQGNVYFVNGRGEIVSKRCTGTCGEIKPIEAFRNNPAGVGGKQSYCSDCQNGRNKKYDASPRGKAMHFMRSQRERIKKAEEKHGVEIANTLNPLHAQIEYGADECNYCGRSLAPNEAHIDHPITYKRVGANDYTNILACCQSCNAKKGSKSLYTFLVDEVDEYHRRKVVFTLATRNLATYEEMWARIKEEAGVGLERVSKGELPRYGDRVQYEQSSDIWALNIYDQTWETLKKEGLTRLFASEADFQAEKIKRNGAINVEKLTIKELENYYPTATFEGTAWGYPEIDKVETWIHAETGEEILVNGETLEFLQWVIDVEGDDQDGLQQAN